MKRLNWNEVKNIWLKMERGIGFEDIQAAIEEGRVLDRVDHHNKQRYPNQRLYIIRVNDYAYIVPYVEDDEQIFLKTIIPSRKATKQYLKGGNKQ